MVLGGLDERVEILGEARAAESRTGVQKFQPNPVVKSDSARYFLHIRADLFAEVGHFVDESDLGSEKSVRRVLDELGRSATRVENRSLIQRQRPIDLRQNSL